MLGICLDSETSGLNPQRHNLIELAIKFLNVETGGELASFETVVSLTKAEWENSDPSSLDVNGFTWEEISKGMPREALHQKLLDLFGEWEIQRGKAVFICQNPSFDRAFFSQVISPDLQEALLWPYHWLDLASMFWADRIQKGRENPNDLPWKTGFSKDKIASACHLP